MEGLKERAVDELPYINGAVHYLVDENGFPAETPFPCLGLKDGDIEGEYFAQADDRVYRVDLVCFQKVMDLDSAVLGRGDERGILDFAADVKAAFIRYSPAGYQWLSLVAEGGSELIATEEMLVQKKKITMRWTAE